MNKKINLKDTIDSFLSRDLELPKIFNEKTNEIFPSNNEPGDWKLNYIPKLKNALTNILDNFDLLSLAQQAKLQDMVKMVEIRLSKVHEAIINTSYNGFIYEFNLLKHDVDELISHLEKKPFRFEYNSSVEYDFNHIINLLKNIYFSGEESFTDITNKISNENSDNIRNIALKEISNFSTNSNLDENSNKIALVNRLNLIYNQFISTKLQAEQRNLSLERRAQEDRLKKEYFQLELTKNSELISAFGDQSKDIQTSIQILYFAIFGVFLLILGSIFYKMNDTLNTSHDWDIRNLYFLSFILSLSALLTFLIKEKNSLTTKRNYFHKCHVELKALSGYVAGIDKDKVEQLKIDLAPTYFTAGETGSLNSNNSEPTLTNDQVTQLIDLLKESLKK